MTKTDVRKIAEEYVLKHKENYKKATKKDVQQAVEKVAKALADVSLRGSRGAKAKARAA